MSQLYQSKFWFDVLLLMKCHMARGDSVGAGAGGGGGGSRRGWRPAYIPSGLGK